jgi:hypothetical protein
MRGPPPADPPEDRNVGSRLRQIIGNKHLAVAGILLAAVGLANCGGDDPRPPVDFEPTLASIQAAVFTPTCATSSCHSNAQKEAGLDLSDGNAWASLVNIDCTTRDADLEGLVRVKPGEGAESFLIHKLRGVPASKGRRMPYDGPYLSGAEIDVIEKWIDDGANP